jgi:hypothetical protein
VGHRPRRTRDYIRVGKGEGRFARVMLIVTESDLEMFDMVIQFGNGGRWSPGLRHFFREGSRSRAIDLPGHVRFIRDIELVYGNMPAAGARTSSSGVSSRALPFGVHAE